MSARTVTFVAGLDEAVELLAAGGLLLFPTETVYGFGARWDRPKAVAAMYEAKGRPEGKPFQVLVADAKAARAIAGEWPDSAAHLAGRWWPGALTLVVPAAPGVPAPAVAEDGSVGLRCPDHDGLRALLRLTGPLTASSANQAGAPPALTCADAVAALGEFAVLALDGGPVRQGVPSSVVRATAGGFELLREGALSLATLQAGWPHG